MFNSVLNMGFLLMFKDFLKVSLVLIGYNYLIEISIIMLRWFGDYFFAGTIPTPYTTTPERVLVLGGRGAVLCEGKRLHRYTCIIRCFRHIDLSIERRRRCTMPSCVRISSNIRDLTCPS